MVFLLNCIHPFSSMIDFDSGVKVLQLRTSKIEETIAETYQLAESLGFIDANRLAKHIGISSILALQRLLEAEKLDKLCRDDSIEGLFFYPNKFLL